MTLFYILKFFLIYSKKTTQKSRNLQIISVFITIKNSYSSHRDTKVNIQAMEENFPLLFLSLQDFPVT